jgi:hypothetical protein
MLIKIMRILYFLCAILLLISCGEKEIWIKDNVPPPDLTVEDIVIENYIQKCYISLLGKKANTNELNAAFELLRENPRDDEKRKSFVNDLVLNPLYFKNEINTIRGDYLNGVDSTEIANQITIFEFIITSTNNAFEIELFENEINRLEKLQNAAIKWENAEITTTDLHVITVNNSFYDDINMGSENFVVSLFQNFAFRYPTVAELNAGKSLFDGAPSVFLLQSGKNKNDLQNIFFNSIQYYEGVVSTLFQRYFYRNPTSFEIELYSKPLIQEKNYTSLQVKLLASKEYMGIK